MESLPYFGFRQWSCIITEESPGYPFSTCQRIVEYKGLSWEYYPERLGLTLILCSTGSVHIIVHLLRCNKSPWSTMSDKVSKITNGRSGRDLHENLVRVLELNYEVMSTTRPQFDNNDLSHRRRAIQTLFGIFLRDSPNPFNQLK